jgi:hypothetical protein
MRSLLASDQEEKIFQDPFEGIQFAGANHETKRKFIKIKEHSQEHIDYQLRKLFIVIYS